MFFFDFSRDVLYRMDIFEAPTTPAHQSVLPPTWRFVSTKLTFFGKSYVSQGKVADNQNEGRKRSPTPGPRNLNENPSPEELSGITCTGKFDPAEL